MKPFTQNTPRKTYDLDALEEPAQPLQAAFGHPPALRWTVTPPNSTSAASYVVDLHQLAFGFHPGKPLASLLNPVGTRPASLRSDDEPRDQLALVSALAPSIKKYTETKHIRSSFEFLSTFRWFFRFLNHYETLMGSTTPITQLSDLTESVGLLFSDWLRHQRLEAARMSSVYAAASSALKRALGTPPWRPNPFSAGSSVRALDRSSDTPLTHKQVHALITVCKEQVRKFQAARVATLAQRRIARAIDPHNALRPYDAPNTLRGAFAIRDRIGMIREHLASGLELTEIADTQRLSLFPSADLIAACFLLCLLRTPTNEQPLLSAVPGRWWSTNPFGPTYRSLRLQKHRTGKKSGRSVPTELVIPVNARPHFYTFRIMRYVELLTGPLRQSMQHALANSTTPALTSTRAQRHANTFWLYIDGNSRWCALTGHSVNPVINQFIATHARTTPGLLDEQGKPIRYRAKQIRDAYLAFALRESNYQLEVGSQELGHGPDSASIRNYLNHTWARTFAHGEHRKWQSAAFAVASDIQSEISPATISGHLSGAKASPMQPEALRFSRERPLVRHGLRCEDPTHPPEHIYVPKHEGDVCPARDCDDCEWGRLFKSGLPELARSILNLRSQRDDTPLMMWASSSAEGQLVRLEELMSRWEPDQVTEAFAQAEFLDTPPMPFMPPRIS